MLTEERNPNTERIDQLATLDMLYVINDEDQRVAQVVRDAIPQIARAVEAVTSAFARGGRLIYVGAGTSGRLGVLDAVECVPTFSIDPSQVQGLLAGGIGAMTRSVEGAEDRFELGEREVRALGVSEQDVVVGIAASGMTPYVLGAVAAANDAGAVTVGISCNVPAPLLDAAQIAIALPVGAEVVSGSTRLKAGTAQKMVLNMISTASMIRSGKVYGNLMVDVQVVNDKLARRARRIITQVTDVDDAAAADLLARAGSNAKVAIVMHKCGVDLAEARALLDAANGHLRAVIGG